MDSPKTGFTSIDEYIATFPAEIQAILQAVRATVKDAAPDATEKISYQMPTFYLHGNLVHFAAFKNHIGFAAEDNLCQVDAEQCIAGAGHAGAVESLLRRSESNQIRPPTKTPMSGCRMRSSTSVASSGESAGDIPAVSTSVSPSAVTAAAGAEDDRPQEGGQQRPTQPRRRCAG
ncbi:MAG: DUF1801 domain-containing protein [Caldilineaceae bacterium]